MFEYSFIYPCWTSTACCSLLTWAETNCGKQLIIYGEVIISNSMMITGITRGISQLQIPHHQDNDLLKRHCGHPEDSPARSLTCRIWMFFVRTVRLSSTWLVIFTQKQHVTFKMVKVTSCSVVRSPVSCLFCSRNHAKPCCLFLFFLKTDASKAQWK